MTIKTVSRMTDDGVVDVMDSICLGLMRITEDNPELGRELLQDLIYKFLEPLASEDAFGTEGWEKGLGVEE